MKEDRVCQEVEEVAEELQADKAGKLEPFVEYSVRSIRKETRMSRTSSVRSAPRKASA